jgi:DNA mismatch repair protein MutS2
MEKARLEAEQLARETEKNNETSKRYREQIELEREKVTALARKEAQSIIDETRLAVQEVLREINDLRRSAEKSVDWQRVNEARAQLGQRLNRMEEQLGTHQTEEVPPPSPRAVKPGDTVRIIKFGTTGTVLSVDRDRNLTVQAGILKVSVREDEVRLEENSGKSELRKYMAKSESSLQNLPVSREVDLRGMLPEEATFSLQKYLDAAYRAHLEEVRIIHGKGTGVLRQAVAAYLKNDPHVLSFRPGRYGEGETGVTVAQLK